MAGTGDRIFKALTGGAGLAVLGAFVYLLWMLGKGAMPAFEAFGPRFVASTSWNPDTTNPQLGALPFLFGTVVTSFFAILFALPLALGTAIALALLLPKWLATPIGILVEMLAAVPSIIFGVWGFVYVVPKVRDVAGFLHQDTFGPSLLAASVVLAIMVLPIITAVSRDMVLAVPRHQRDAALALGATDWEVTWRVILPNARAGISAAVLLGLGRAIGETMAVILVIGNQTRILLDLFEPGSTMASVIANEFGDPSSPVHRASLYALGLLLLALSLGVSLFARAIVRRRARGAV